MMKTNTPEKENKEKITCFLFAVMTLLFIAVSGILSAISLRYFSRFPEDYNEGFVNSTPDSPVINILVLLVLIVVGFCLKLIWDKIRISRRTEEIIVAVYCLAFFALFCLIVYKFRVVPVCGQMQIVVDARLFRQGNYEDMRGYLNTYQQQFGLLFFEELLMNITEDYRLFQYLNALLGAGILYAIYHITALLFPHKKTRVYALLLVSAFAPVYFYINFVYGEIPSLAFSLFAIWALIAGFKKYDATKQKKYFFLFIPAVLSFIIAYIVRESMVILSIAIAIALIFYAIRARSGRSFISLALIPVFIFLPMLASTGIKQYYQHKSGITLTPPHPYIGIITMGLQETDRGNGFYNGYPAIVFDYQAGQDVEKAKEIYLRDLNDRLEEMKASPEETRLFFKLKIMQQWNETTYNSVVNTHTFDGEPGPTVQKIYSAEYGNAILNYCNRYGFVLYALLHIFGIWKLYSCIAFLINKKNMPSVWDALFVAYVIGGFLFSLIWEAKPRYVLPYVLFAIPLAAASLSGISTALTKLIPHKNSHKDS